MLLLYKKTGACSIPDLFLHMADVMNKRRSESVLSKPQAPPCSFPGQSKHLPPSRDSGTVKVPLNSSSGDIPAVVTRTKGSRTVALPQSPCSSKGPNVSPSHCSPMKEAGGEKRPGLEGLVLFPSCSVQHLSNTLTSPIAVPLNSDY